MRPWNAQGLDSESPDRQQRGVECSSLGGMREIGEQEAKEKVERWRPFSDTCFSP